jgi:hypothetical protein
MTPGSWYSGTDYHQRDGLPSGAHAIAAVAKESCRQRGSERERGREGVMVME